MHFENSNELILLFYVWLAEVEQASTTGFAVILFVSLCVINENRRKSVLSWHDLDLILME